MRNHVACMDYDDLFIMLLVIQLLGTFFYSIAIATKENLQSQKTALKKISETMNSLASILCKRLYGGVSPPLSTSDAFGECLILLS